ncbi:hypothetical protein DFH28DRAFT_1223723 [Melampsora americana]|nr:hypothetical protein DFH28DRAFT_1223723 [Melampsora americana]
MPDFAASITSDLTSYPDDNAESIISRLNTYQHPSVYPYVRWVLIACGIFYLLVIILCVTILAIPMLGGRVARRRHLWLWRRHYVGDTGPYLIPNGGLFLIICQLLGSIPLEMYILFSYQAIRSSIPSRSNHQCFWLAISYAPGYFGYWYSGFTALYLCLFSPSRPLVDHQLVEHFLPHPIFMNTLCIGVPIFVAMGALFWGITSIVSVRQKDDAYAAVLAQLTSGLDPTASLQQYAEAGQRYISRFRWGVFYWSIAALIAVIFYCFTGLLFLRFLKGTVNVATGKTKLWKEVDEAFDVDDDSDVVIAPSVSENSRMGESLLKGYRFLVWQFSFLILVLLWDLMVGIVLTMKIGEIVENEGWRSASIWVVVSSSYLMSGALFLNSWRVLTTRDETQEPPPPPLKIAARRVHRISESQFSPVRSSISESGTFTGKMITRCHRSEEHLRIPLK